ncbi:MAG TPA: GerMN domain-containing protein [Coleofasciculaceae cyanobacterium]
MFSIGKSTLLSFSLLLIIGVISSGGSKVISAISSPTLQPLAESSTNQTETLSNTGQILSQQINLTQQASPAVSTPAPAALKKVQVFFPKLDSQDFTYVEPVWRTTSSQSVAQFSIEQLIAGPTSQEKARSLIAPIQLRGSSNCGKDFTLSISNEVATLRFCKSVLSSGDGDDGRQKSSINTTLKQFSTINSVIILDRNGNCLADQSGENPCLKKPEKLTTQSRLSIYGLGSVEINMSVAQASRVAGTPIVPFKPNPNRVCDYYKPANGPEGVTFMVSEGRIATVEIETNKIVTNKGTKIGDSESLIKSLYPAGEIQTTRLANSEKGKSWIVQPSRFAERNLRLVYVSTNGKTVTRLIAGKVPEVNYIEGCLDVRPE